MIRMNSFNSGVVDGDSVPYHSSVSKYRSQQKPPVTPTTSSSVTPTTSSSVISLNVGGIHYTTLRTTLLKYHESMLAVMFSGRHEIQTDLNGAYFIDRDGTYFSYILDFLRTESLPPNDVAVRVLNEARYFGLSELEDRMSIIPSVASLLVKENHRLQFPDYHEFKRRVIQIAMENATATRIGEVLIHAFRQEFLPKNPNFNVNHNCTADQAHISVGPWEGMVDEDALIRCLESDLIEDQFQLRLHEGKRRCKYFSGQSCQRCVFKIQISFS